MASAAGTVLGDAFANPLAMGALATHRDGTIDPGDTGARPRPPLKRPNAADYDGETLDRWEPWVRAAIAQQVLLAGLHVEQTADGASVWSVERGGRAGGTPTFATTKIAEILRPRDKAYEPQLALVLSWAELRQERAAEILAQIDNQFAFLGAVVYLHPARTPRTFELLGIAIQMAVNVEMRVKHALGVWRPVEISPQVQPMLTTPGHGALPSGHATQAYLTAYVLEKLLNLQLIPHEGEILQLQRQAARIATNRVIAGVHYPMDSMAGARSAMRSASTSCSERPPERPRPLGEHEVLRLRRQGAADRRARRVSSGSAVARWHRGRRCASLRVLSRGAGRASPPSDPRLVHLWRRAAQEWTGKFGR